MKTLFRIILVMFAVQWTSGSYAAEPLPPAIKGFCDMAFAGLIARKGQPFNPTEVLDPKLPSRRILDYVVKGHYAYLWYEHGGYHYHQHLVKFSNTKPYEVKASYVFDSTTHKDIHKLMNDTKFLSSHLSNQCGL